MRVAFLLQRLFGYLAVLCGLLLLGHPFVWWQWIVSVLVIAWGSLDQWKRPDANERVMRRGVAAEMILIGLWAFLLHDAGSILFMLVSPVARGCVHLRLPETSWFGSLALLMLVCIHALYPASPLPFGLQIVALLAMGTYSAVLGALLRQRDRLRRLVMMDTFEREQRAKTDERIRLAGELHDTVGQYWTAVIRALDVALVVDGEKRDTFMAKAREAAAIGLQETRASVHNWNFGRQQASSWMTFAEDSLRRVAGLAGIELRFSPKSVEWNAFSNPDRAGEWVGRGLIESVTNAVRHGAASTVWITMQEDETSLHVVIRDDGRGFGTHQFTRAGNETTGIGMQNLKRDGEVLGGEIRVESRPGSGTTVVLWLPKATDTVAWGNDSKA